MQFGGAKKTIGIDFIEAELNSAFDKELESINSRISSIMAKFDSSREALHYACGQMERETALPDIEYMNDSAIRHIAEQKSTYIGALRRMLESYGVEQKKNRYAYYLAILGSMKSLLDEILKLNGKFRLVLEGYANRLGKFRSSFSSMEKLAKEMETVVSSKEADFKRYNEVLSEIERLRAFSDEFDGLTRAEEITHTESTDPIAGNEERVQVLNGMLTKKSAELDVIMRSIEGVEMEILHITSPIEKAAKKYAHGIGSSMMLLSYINNTVGSLEGNPEAMKNFVLHAESLKKEIESGRIYIKNKMEAIQALELVIKGNVGALIEEISILKSKAAPVMQEIDSIKRRLDEISRENEHKKVKLRESEDLVQRIAELSKAKELSKKKIEELFLRNYRMQITLDC